jgi:hypothetical protein
MVAHQGAEIGVLEHIEAAARPRATLLHVRGGVSGSLEYIIPSHAVVDVQVASRRACVDDKVTFEPGAIAEDGTVVLIATFPGAEGSPAPPAGDADDR